MYVLCHGMLNYLDALHQNNIYIYYMYIYMYMSYFWESVFVLAGRVHPKFEVHVDAEHF